MQQQRICTTDGTSVRIADRVLALSASPWGYAERHRDAMAAYWESARTERPKMFDGPVHVLIAHALQGGTFNGTFARTDFKSFLHWREHGAPGPTRDGFGSALIRSSDGCVLLGLQSLGNLNAGFAYPPSGLIEPADTEAGCVDIDANIARELEEETGLAPADLERTSGLHRHDIGSAHLDGNRVAQRVASTLASRATFLLTLRASPTPSSPTS